MKTLDFEAGPDQVVETLSDGRVKVRRKVCFLSAPEGVRISTVSSPANGMPFSALKSTAVKGAVPVHDPPKADEAQAWDSGAAVGRLRSWAGVDGEAPDWAKFAKGFAWTDPGADNLGGFKLPHHDVQDGQLVTVWTGVAAAMGALRGARGGVQLPDADRAAVEAHLVAHYQQFGKPVPGEPEATGAEKNVDPTNDPKTATKDAATKTDAPDEATLVQTLKRLLGIAPAVAVADKSRTLATSIAQVQARDKFWDDFWSLRRAFQDVVDGAVCCGEDLPEGTDPAQVVNNASVEFTTRVAALVAQAKAAGVFTAKAEDAPRCVKAEASEDAAVVGIKLSADALATSKAGKVLSSANEGLVRQAVDALTALLAAAAPAPVPEVPKVEAQPGAAGAVAGSEKAAGAPGPAGQETTMDATKVLAAIKAGRLDEATKLLEAESSKGAETVTAEAGKEAEAAAPAPGKPVPAMPVKPEEMPAAVKARLDQMDTAIKSGFEALEAQLVGALKAITGLEDQPDPQGQAIARQVNGAMNPAEAANDAGQFRYQAPTGDPLGTPIPVQGNAPVAAASPSVKSMEDRLAGLEALIGARPAAKAQDATGQRDGSEMWGASIFG